MKMAGIMAKQINYLQGNKNPNHKPQIKKRINILKSKRGNYK